MLLITGRATTLDSGQPKIDKTACVCYPCDLHKLQSQPWLHLSCGGVSVAPRMTVSARHFRAEELAPVWGITDAVPSRLYGLDMRARQ